jgi:signal transduction histidine kinase
VGLSIVSDIVQAHKGQVAVESEVGRGSTFRVVFPRLPAGGAAAVHVA